MANRPGNRLSQVYEIDDPARVLAAQQRYQREQQQQQHHMQPTHIGIGHHVYQNGPRNSSSLPYPSVVNVPMLGHPIGGGLPTTHEHIPVVSTAPRPPVNHDYENMINPALQHQQQHANHNNSQQMHHNNGNNATSQMQQQLSARNHVSHRESNHRSSNRQQSGDQSSGHGKKHHNHHAHKHSEERADQSGHAAKPQRGTDERDGRAIQNGNHHHHNNHHSQPVQQVSILPPQLPQSASTDTLRSREIHELKARISQLEKTLKWWTDCTNAWREKWSKMKQERNKAREETKSLQKRLTEVQEQMSAIREGSDNGTLTTGIGSLMDDSRPSSIRSGPLSLEERFHLNLNIDRHIGSRRSLAVAPSAGQSGGEVVDNRLMQSQLQDALKSLINERQEKLKVIQSMDRLQNDFDTLRLRYNVMKAKRPESQQQELSQMDDQLEPGRERRLSFGSDESGADWEGLISDLEMKQREVELLESENSMLKTRLKSVESKLKRRGELGTGTRDRSENKDNKDKIKEEANSEQLAEQIKQLEEQLTDRTERLEEMRSIHTSLKQEYQDKCSELARASRQSSHLERECKKLRSKCNELKRRLYSSEQQLDDALRTIRMLKEFNGNISSSTDASGLVVVTAGPPTDFEDSDHPTTEGVGTDALEYADDDETEDDYEPDMNQGQKGAYSKMRPHSAPMDVNLQWSYLPEQSPGSNNLASPVHGAQTPKKSPRRDATMEQIDEQQDNEGENKEDTDTVQNSVSSHEGTPLRELSRQNTPTASNLQPNSTKSPSKSPTKESPFKLSTTSAIPPSPSHVSPLKPTAPVMETNLDDDDYIPLYPRDKQTTESSAAADETEKDVSGSRDKPTRSNQSSPAKQTRELCETISAKPQEVTETKSTPKSSPLKEVDAQLMNFSPNQRSSPKKLSPSSPSKSPPIAASEASDGSRAEAVNNKSSPAHSGSSDEKRETII